MKIIGEPPRCTPIKVELGVMEARQLRILLGRLSLNDIRKLLDGVTSAAAPEDVIKTTSELFNVLSNAGV